MKAIQNDSERSGQSVPFLEQPTESMAAHLRTTLQSAGDGVIVTDLQGNVEFLNTAAERLLGIDSEVAEGRPLNEILCLEESDGRAVRGNLVELAIVSEAPIALGKDLLLRSDSGSTKQIEGEICVRSGAGNITGSVVTFRDVTARNWDELQRREEQKMRAVGQLAGAVAHDLNNMLTIIVGHRETIDEMYPGLPSLAESTSEIQRAANEISTVARQLLILSRREVLVPKPTSLNTLLTQLRPKLEKMNPGNIDLTFSLAPELGTVMVDPGPMGQAITELVAYCTDRVQSGGKIEISTSNVVVDRNFRARHLKRFVELSVKDTGASLRRVPPEKLFEPAWVREAGRPSGLGLFTIRNVVNAAKGHFSLESEGAIGAKFVLLLPETDEEVLPSAPAAVAGVMPVHPTILLVEDDDAIRILLRNSLEKRGYRVIEARNGEEAIFQVELHEEPIHLLISDVVMPVMDGATLARELARTHAGLRTLLISGCPEDLIDVQELVDSGAHFVQKPFTQRQLVAKVENILGPRAN